MCAAQATDQHFVFKLLVLFLLLLVRLQEAFLEWVLLASILIRFVLANETVQDETGNQASDSTSNEKQNRNYLDNVEQYIKGPYI